MKNLKVQLTVATAIILLIIAGFYEQGEPDSNKSVNEFVGKMDLHKPSEALNIDYARFLGSALPSGAKLVLINFWATWCAPCVQELRDFATLADDFNGKLSIIAVGVGESEETIEKFRKQQNLLSTDIHFISDTDKEAAEQYGIEFLPATFIAEPDGNVLFTVLGIRDWKGDEFIDFLDQLARRPAKSDT